MIYCTTEKKVAHISAGERGPRHIKDKDKNKKLQQILFNICSYLKHIFQDKGC